jgi:colanic acid/amylovoran biosynthesis glycosyltransferase
MKQKSLHLASRHHPIRILCVADLDWRNGHEFALQALRVLKEDNLPFEFRLIGNGPFLEAVAFARHEFGLESEVEFKLHIVARELDRCYAWADIFLLAAVAPGARHGLMEASRWHLPIICTDILKSNAAHIAMTIIQRRDPIQIAESLKYLIRQ